MAADLNIVVNGTPVPVYLGENTALSLAAKNSAAASAAAAALSEATAESAAGPTYPDTAAGLAATADGQAFAVDNGDGTVTIYLNDDGSAVEQRTLATTAALSSSLGGVMVGTAAGGSVEKAIPHVTPEQRGAVSGDSGTAAAFLDFLEYCRDNGVQGRLKKGAIYYLAPNSFTLSDGERLDLTCEDVAGAVILPTVSENSYLFTCSDAAELNLRGIRLGDGTGTRLISMSSSTASDKEWSLSLDNCIIDASGSDTRSLVVCYGYRKQLRIRNCTFIGSATATDNVSIHAGQTLLDCGGVENISETSSQIIDGCLFFGGTLAYNHAGTNQPGPTIYTNNQHFNQTVAGARFYHAWQVIADNLLFEGIKGKSDTAAAWQGYSIFIDNFGPSVANTRSQYGSITVRNCSGIGVMCEEIFGSVIGPLEVAGISAVAGHSGAGGHGLLIGGGCEHLTVTGSIAQCNEAAVRINKDITSIKTTQQNVQLMGMHIFDNQKGGVLIESTVRSISIMGGSMHNNSGASSGTYDDINNNAAVSYFAVKDVSFFDGATPSNSRRNINDDTSGSSIVWDIQANLFYANDTSVVSVKPTRGQALGNTLWQTGKSITWTGSAFAVRDNMRFKTQWAGSITTTAGSAYTIPTATMALGSGSAAAELVQATYVGTDPDYKVSANINAGAVEIRLSDETGALVAGTVHVVASRLAAWQSA